MSKRVFGNDIDKYDIDNLENKYKTGDMTRTLGTTRDTLRYYEEIGILHPDKNNDNNYREFTFYEIFQLFGIEFYKKRGLTLQQIKQITEGTELSSIEDLLSNSKKELDIELAELQKKINRIENTKQFISEYKQNLNTFIIKKIPLYKIVSSYTASSALDEYEEHVIAHMDLEKDDMFSHMVKRMTFDQNGYIDSNMYILEPADKKEAGCEYLPEGEYMSVIVESGRYNDDEHTIGADTLKKGLEFCEKNNLEMLGEVYLFLKLVLFKDGKERILIEACSPIKRK
ncbi:MerR family transcriptional regulator [Breznakia pachnodae]|uniref:DNA-binding transcriptional MerR regulator n=1 Tax=Breznakia pachnodae TaxID=265178 RepID=A0ABU0E8A9_9FIRM|nr:MerR family transcriptional regulator [Breznakia pachnodae]MDQ0363133.1 DNA-binding transcriptional MerR regulator [Breznakia pachnodae]